MKPVLLPSHLETIPKHESVEEPMMFVASACYAHSKRGIEGDDIFIMTLTLFWEKVKEL